MTDEPEIEVVVYENADDDTPLDSATLPLDDAWLMAGNVMHDLDEGEENLIRVRRSKTDAA